MSLSKDELRQVICDKLVEMGCLLDDELPDYVAAMVANRKSREHMAKDLSVFIGVQCEPFLNWLMDLVKEKKVETTVMKSSARLVTRDEQEQPASRRTAAQAASKGSSSSSRLLSLAVAKATADTAKSQSTQDDTSNQRHPQPIAEGSSSHSGSGRKRTHRSSPDSRHRESRSSKSHSSSSESRRNGEKPASSSVKTKFFVTLDGANSFKDSLEKKKEVVEPTDSVTFTVSNVSTDLKRRHIEVEESVNGEAYDGVPATTEDTQDVVQGSKEPAVEPAAKRPLERCRFWPQCTTGDSCPFQHPTAPCRKMPNCRFGAQCLYLHPDCKFDGHCARADCPYVHRLQTKGGVFTPSASPTAKSPSVKPSPSSTICKFHPNCMRPNCSFLHPTPCRFGNHCSRAGCNFYHAQVPETPSVPDWNSLRWSAKKHISDRKFAADEASESVVVGSSEAAIPVAADS